MRILISTFLAAALLLSSAISHAAGPVNINTADAATLAEALKGVGLERAEAIVTYRETNGPFKNVDDLVQVSGVGQATVDKNRANLTVK